MQHGRLEHVNAKYQDERSQDHGSPVKPCGGPSHDPPGEIGESHLQLKVIALAEILAHAHRITAMKHRMAHLGQHPHATDRPDRNPLSCGWDLT